MNINKDDKRLQSLLDVSATAIPESQEYWFSRQNQNKLMFDHASKLLVADSSYDADSAIREARTFVNAFYNTVLKQTTKTYRG